ncbi:hypothetical protein GLAREA_09166 [Glarea lozoyensis ATCC 20868]|uniref:Heterokaryon incompatibility domain-containing protein n=1 Tax=Glarea lozoyensis (strain ATCC 20868 / MF5171) TaxID=1116229 RepID=S3EFN9_GLAL2|nr:uncharacterized protein GLAREA_09166 [Glarea lozoyensis ATCC 20868]EPE37003.1 hypothetical protein GLAREA_09166 [Glarea lozoyensis ATCC 20868]
MQLSAARRDILNAPPDLSKLTDDLYDLAQELENLKLEQSVQAVVYSPLNEALNKIRVLSFVGGEEEVVLRCKVEIVSLDALKEGACVERNGGESWESQFNAPQHRFTWGDFATLSYVWGSGRSRKIILNEQPTYIGANLEAALRSLRGTQRFNGRFRLWVDALCINQKDVEERGRQVKKMHMLYSSAWIVISWAGEERNGSPAAMLLLDRLAAASRSGAGREVEACLKCDPAYFGVGCWFALHEFMQREYWSRVWVIQEVVLGSKRVVLRCGKWCLDWESFCTGLVFLSDYLWTVKDELLKRDLALVPRRRGQPQMWSTTSCHLITKDLWPMSKMREEKSRRDWLDFGRLLVLANSANSSDVRDKVYGLIGMMDPLVSQQLVPDYISSSAVIFAKVLQVYIETYQDLEPIREGNCWGKMNAPTWAADWTWDGRLRYNRPETRFWGPFWETVDSTRLAVPAEPYRASGDTKADILGLGSREDGYFEWPRESIINPKQQTSAYGDESGIRKALYTALVADRVDKGRKAEGRHAAIFHLPSSFEKGKPQFDNLGWKWLGDQEGYYFRWGGWVQANREFMLWGHRLGDFFDDVIPDDASEYDFMEVYCGVDRTAKARRFMTTENGCLGWCPSNIYGEGSEQTQVGDLIAILFGCSTPIVIRPFGEQFKVVGEAYVQGFMDEEGIGGWESGRYTSQQFTFV